MDREHIASIHIKPCKIAQSEMHNRRDMEYLNSLDPAKLYIRTDLMHLNETYVAPGMEGVSLQELYDSIKVMVKEKTGRAMQEKDVEYIGKNGKKKVRQGCSPIRESVVNIKSDTTMDELLRYSERVHEKWGIKVVQIHIHKDEGHYENVQDPTTWKPNLHAHIIWDWMNHSTGKSYKLNADDMSEMQDMAAETLAMERGKKKSETGADHLERNDYILQKQREEQERLQKEAEEVQAKKKAAEQQAAAAKEQLDMIEEQTKAKKDAIAELDERITNKTKKDNTLAAGLIQKTHQDKVLTTEIQSKRRSVKSLDREIENKSGILDGLDGEISVKEETKSGLDADIATKKETIGSLDADIATKEETIDGLDADIEEKNEKVGNLDEEIKNLFLAHQNIQLFGGDWKDKLLRSLAVILYNSDEQLRACVKIIQDFACAKRAGRGGEYKACFWDEESSAIKNYMEFFHEATKVTAQHVASFLVWLSSELGNFNDYEKGRAAREVNDVAIGRYDWRIQKHKSGRGRGR